MKTPEEIEQLAEQYWDTQPYNEDAYVVGYTQCQQDMVKDFLLLIKEYKDKELPNCNKPFHHEAEISSGLDGLVNYIKNKQD